jgi:hypothetical protein
VVFRILGQHLLLDSFRIAVLYCVREIVDVGACLPNKFKTCGLSVPWMDRHHPIFGKRFEFVQAYRPAFKVSFLQIKVRLVLDQIRREKRFQFGSVHGLMCLVSPSPNSTISSLTPSSVRIGSAKASGTTNRRGPSRPSFSCSIENIHGPSVPMSVTTFCVETT